MYVYMYMNIFVEHNLLHVIDEILGSRKLRLQNAMRAILRIRNSEKLSFVELGGQSLGQDAPLF